MHFEWRVRGESAVIECRGAVNIQIRAALLNHAIPQRNVCASVLHIAGE